MKLLYRDQKLAVIATKDVPDVEFFLHLAVRFRFQWAKATRLGGVGVYVLTITNLVPLTHRQQIGLQAAEPVKSNLCSTDGPQHSGTKTYTEK